MSTGHSCRWKSQNLYLFYGGTQSIFCPASMYSEYFSHAVFVQLEMRPYFAMFLELCHESFAILENHVTDIETSVCEQLVCPISFSLLTAARFADRTSMHSCKHLTTTTHPQESQEQVFICSVYSIISHTPFISPLCYSWKIRMTLQKTSVGYVIYKSVSGPRWQDPHNGHINDVRGLGNSALSHRAAGNTNVLTEIRALCREPRVQ